MSDDRLVTDFPKLDVAPGRFAAEWHLDAGPVAGELELEPGRPPTLSLFGDVAPVNWGDGKPHEFPQHHRLPRVAGRLRSNQDVVLTDVDMVTWFPRNNYGAGRFAIVGLRIADVPDDAYRRVRLQVTGADLLFGIAPLKSFRWPLDGAPHLEGEYAAIGNPISSHTWQDDDLTVDCRYDLRFALNPYQGELTLAPIVEMSSSVPRNIDEWMRVSIRPLLRIASLATRRPQRCAWLTVHTTSAADEADPGAQPRTGVVFAAGIDQAPYAAEAPQELTDVDRRPLFTLAVLPVGLPALLRTWLKLQTDANPFVELVGLALYQQDLPERSRFLYLVQALEALHGHENQAAEERAQEAFKATRAEVLEVLRLSLDAVRYRFLREHWENRRPSLEHRLAELMDALPSGVRAGLARPETAAVEARLVARGAKSIAAQLARLRNDLSHGAVNYGDHELSPWVRAVERICCAHLLRLLGFDASMIERALAQPAADR